MLPSDISIAQYNLNTVQEPVFSKTPGIYNDTQYVSLSCGTSGAVIKYTLDNTEPSRTNGYVYNGESIIINSTLKIKAFAYKDGMIDSQVVTGTFIIKAADPILNYQSGTYDNSISVIANCSTPGATMRYTIDGTDPTPTYGTIYTGPINITSSRVFKIIAYKNGIENSNIVVRNYTIKTADPFFSPASGTYNTNQSVTITIVQQVLQ